MTKGRRSELAVRLADGRVLVAGDGSSYVPTGEIYDPAKNRWTATAATGINRNFTAPLQAYGLLLPDGRVLTTLGMGYYSAGAPTTYDPNANKWTVFPSAPVFLGWGARIALLPNGHVLFAGGSVSDWSGYDVASGVVEELDPTTGSWTQRPSSPNTGIAGALTTLANGTVLFSGGTSNDALYDPAAAPWTSVPASAGDRNTVTTLLDGTALSVGGYAIPTNSQRFSS